MWNCNFTTKLVWFARTLEFTHLHIQTLAGKISLPLNSQNIIFITKQLPKTQTMNLLSVTHCKITNIITPKMTNTAR